MKATSATLAFCVVLLIAPIEAFAGLKAGAAIVDVTPPQLPVESIYENLPASEHTGIDVRTFLAAIADNGGLYEYKRDYAPGRGDNIVAGKIRIKGLPVGVIGATT